MAASQISSFAAMYVVVDMVPIHSPSQKSPLTIIGMIAIALPSEFRNTQVFPRIYDFGRARKHLP